jgi:hypothetical protein
MPISLPTWDQTKKYRGRWWPAGSPDLSFPGKLRFKDRSPTLTVKSPSVGQEVFEFGVVDTIHGQLETGELVTLWDVQGHHLQHLVAAVSDAHSKHRRSFTFAIFGEHLKSHDDQTFTYSAFRLHGLDEWSRMTKPIPRGLEPQQLPQYTPATLSGFESSKYGSDYTVEARVELPMRIETDHRFPHGAIMDHTGENVRVVFECTPPAPAGFHNLLLFDLQALLTFSYQSGAPVKGEWLAISDPCSPLSVLKRDSFNGRKVNQLDPSQMIVSASKMDPADLFPSWWRAVHDLYPAPQVITIYNHGSRGILEGSTSSAIAAAEHLHGLVGATKTRFPGGFLAAKAAELKSKYPGADNAEFRQFLREALKNNRPTLTTRLKELAATVTTDRMALLGIDEKDWMGGVKAVRDKLAHTSSHVGRRNDGSSVQLEQVNIQTRAIITMLILKQLSLSELALDEAAEALAAEMERLQ